MAAEATCLEKQLASARHQRSSGKLLLGVALRAVCLDELRAVQMNCILLAPVCLDGVAQQRLGPERILAVRVGHFQAASLPIVAGRYTQTQRIVPPLPAPVTVHIAHGRRDTDASSRDLSPS